MCVETQDIASLQEETPDGVTTSAGEGAKQSQSPDCGLLIADFELKNGGGAWRASPVVRNKANPA
jgi:hypothetical protein